MNTQDLSKLSKEQLVALLEANTNELMVKKTDKGGIYIKHPSFLAYSANKGKDYVQGINMSERTAKALFENKQLLDQIIKAVKSM